MQEVSLLPAFEGKTLSRADSIFWEHEGNKAVRDGRWKLVRRHTLPWQLFDMEADRTEQRDVSREDPEIVSRLQVAWGNWAARTFVDEWNGPGHTEWGQDIKKTD